MISPGENRIQSVLNSHEELQKIGQYFQVSIHFHLSHLQTKMIDPSFCMFPRRVICKTKLNYYFNVPIRYKYVFSLFKVTLKISDTSSLKTSEATV